MSPDEHEAITGLTTLTQQLSNVIETQQRGLERFERMYQRVSEYGQQLAHVQQDSVLKSDYDDMDRFIREAIAKMTMEQAYFREKLDVIPGLSRRMNTFLGIMLSIVLAEFGLMVTILFFLLTHRVG